MLSWLQPRALFFVIPGGSGGFPPINVELYRDHRAFRESIDAIAPIIESMLDWNPAAAFRGESQAPMPPELERRNELVHHGMTRIALIDQWRADGITPDGAAGVSLGEVIAPYAVGAITREECTRLMTVVSHSVTDTPSPHRVFIVKADHETANRLCRQAPAPVDFLGASTPELSLVLLHDRDADVLRSYFGERILKDAPSGWPYHTPNMHWNVQWSRAQLGDGFALRAGSRPIYSPAAGGLLPMNTRFDARCIRWMMTGPSHFVDAIADAIADGFDTFVQVTGRPMHVYADVTPIAEAMGKRVRELHAFDAKARATVRRMRRRAVVPQVRTANSFKSTRSFHGPETDRIAERLLQPLVERKPFDVVSSFADPLADGIDTDRDSLRRTIASSVLQMLHDPSLRNAESLTGENEVAVDALRALLRVAPDFVPFQPLETVRLDGNVLQLMIAR